MAVQESYNYTTVRTTIILFETNSSTKPHGIMFRQRSDSPTIVHLAAAEILVNETNLYIVCKQNKNLKTFSNYKRPTDTIMGLCVFDVSATGRYATL